MLDPFAGSGTTLVQALESGLDATGVDVAAVQLPADAREDARATTCSCSSASCATRCARLEALRRRAGRPRPRAFVRDWYAPKAAAELLFFRSLIADYEHADVLRVVLARAARSARRTTHFDLDFPREPQTGRTGATSTGASAARSSAPSTSSAATRSTRSRGSRSSRACARAAARRVVLHGDARELELGGRFDGVVTSPPYPGLIDYHEQHRYAYELLGLDDLRELELGAAERGTSATALGAYSTASRRCSRTRARALRSPGAPVVIVDQRPPRALPGDPRARRACGSRRAIAAT